jgi:hypothetical protein
MAKSRKSDREPVKPVLMTDLRVAQRYDVVVRTLERWDLQPDLKFPRPVWINGRRFREVAKLDAWDRRIAKANRTNANFRDPRAAEA